MDFKTIDKKDWVCFKLAGEQVYYGEVMLLDDKGNLHKQGTPDVQGTLVRHGKGIQTYSDKEGTAKYQGDWAKDKKNGKGKFSYADGSTYQGNFKNDMKFGTGNFLWSSGQTYHGNWRLGRFEGAGLFTKGIDEFKGIFKNGYFLLGDSLINPFLGHESNGLNNFKLREKQNKLKYFFFQKITDLTRLAPLIKKSTSQNRVPIILSSDKSTISKEKVFENLGRPVSQFDLRRASILKSGQKQKYKQFKYKVRQDLSRCILNGQIMAINLDDSDVIYEFNYYPDINELYDSACFPYEIWEPEKMKRREVYEAIVGEYLQKSGIKGEVSPNGEMSLVLWSKFQVRENWESKRIIQTVNKRFASILPIIKIDIIIVSC